MEERMDLVYESCRKTGQVDTSHVGLGPRKCLKGWRSCYLLKKRLRQIRPDKILHKTACFACNGCIGGADGLGPFAGKSWVAMA